MVETPPPVVGAEAAAFDLREIRVATEAGHLDRAADHVGPVENRARSLDQVEAVDDEWFEGVPQRVGALPHPGVVQPDPVQKDQRAKPGGAPDDRRAAPGRHLPHRDTGRLGERLGNGAHALAVDQGVNIERVDDGKDCERIVLEWGGGDDYRRELVGFLCFRGFIRKWIILAQEWRLRRHRHAGDEHEHHAEGLPQLRVARYLTRGSWVEELKSYGVGAGGSQNAYPPCHGSSSHGGYVHRLRRLVHQIGDIRLAVNNQVPGSTGPPKHSALLLKRTCH